MAESENIVADTAEKIFSDLADTKPSTTTRPARGKPALAGADRSRPAAVMGGEDVVVQAQALRKGSAC